MPRVACLGVGGGVNHLCEVEGPEMFAEIIGGRLNGVRMWLLSSSRFPLWSNSRTFFTIRGSLEGVTAMTSR